MKGEDQHGFQVKEDLGQSTIINPHRPWKSSQATAAILKYPYCPSVRLIEHFESGSNLDTTGLQLLESSTG